MPHRTIPIVSERLNTRIPALPSDGSSTEGVWFDTLQRPLHDLRISVTDRCNFRCVYCMPRDVFDQNYPYLAYRDVLTFEEIARLAKLFVAHGVTKIRLTGGEPLLRKDLEKLVYMLRQLDIPGQPPLDLTLTTNGSLLAKKAQILKDAGLSRVTVSLDALDDAVFKRMNDADYSAADVLHGIDIAHQVGFGPIKVNMVVKAGVNDDQIIPMARHFKNSPFILRFIEYMDVGSSNGWKMDEVVPSRTVIDRISQSSPEMKLIPASSNYIGETSHRWKYEDGIGEIGVISSVTQAFCQDCNRLRLSTDGKLYTCLFADHGQDVRELLRNGADDIQITNLLAHIWKSRNDRYSELRGQETRPKTRIEMSYIGG